MYDKVMLSQIPIQALKYSLDKLKSPTNDGKWPRSTIDWIHGAIVDQICQIRVNVDYLNEKSSDVVKPCSVIIEELNLKLNEHMIKNEMAVHKETDAIDEYLKTFYKNYNSEGNGVKEVPDKDEVYLKMKIDLEKKKCDEMLSGLNV